MSEQEILQKVLLELFLASPRTQESHEETSSQVPAKEQSEEEQREQQA